MRHLAATLLILAPLAGCGTATSPTATPGSAGAHRSGPPLSKAARDLATIDGVPQRAAAYERALTRAKRSCPGESRTRLADLSTKAREIIQQKTGRTVDTLRILRSATGAIPRKLRGDVKCVEIFAAYVTLVRSGSAP